MNRKKKVKQTLLKQVKKNKAKLAPSSKPKYISKADREAIAVEAEEHNVVDDNIT
ncbi:DUF2986 domain-containing protein [Ferrimonas lipolytica]|uniref:DUF2986 domain-containing protein n=1 Tax=Ferrimonas lipolytica TaxID=2724191 RepID=A0A6H1UHT1_9GAMM|nr:DUF2986 domain-containing protein [Ferrimonas lipolytica]QIZ77776.1 DUF2986 domain-containing protein [Ferrimonas lipolytica]